MPQLLWFIAGVAVALAAMLLFARTRRTPVPVAAPTTPSAAPPEAVPAPLTDEERAELALARRILDETVRDLDGLASGLGSEIASLATAIEGHALFLVEACGNGGRDAVRAAGQNRASVESLRSSLRRLRTFSEKFLCFARVDDLVPERVDVRTVLREVAQEIDAFGARLRVEIEAAEFLPTVLADRHALRNAIVFLTETLMRIERRATRVSLRARAELREDAATRVEIELSVEADELAEGVVDPAPSEASIRTINLGYVAARNLIEAMAGRLAFDEVEGLSLSCFVSLPVWLGAELDGDVVIESDRPATDAAASGATSIPTTPHHWGGVLILEGDPQVREMLAHELRPTGRKIVSCVDGAAARSLIEATPERFEVAILAEDSRVEGLEAVARLAAERIADIRILVLGSARALREGVLPSSTVLHALRKPFGIDELRRALRELLGAATPGDDAAR